MALDIRAAQFPDNLQEVRALLTAYAQSLEVDLDYQNFDAELRELPGDYAPPAGCLLLAWSDQGVAGCVALKPRGGMVCEMKRLYVPPQFRGGGVGGILAEAVIRKARGIGYGEMLLDSLPSMESAQALYRRLGFAETAPYYDTPVAGTVFMKLELAPPR
jgi:GNAT superfamily N-acetyltransferase